MEYKKVQVRQVHRPIDRLVILLWRPDMEGLKGVDGVYEGFVPEFLSEEVFETQSTSSLVLEGVVSKSPES